jgi:hypothetical protein
MEESQTRGVDLSTRLLRGVEAGIVGGVAMLALLICGSLLEGRGWWSIPNLLGSTFYGVRALRAGPALATLSGAAFHFTITGAVGAVLGVACGGMRQRTRMLLSAVLAALFWYYFTQTYFWPRVNARVPIYAPQPLWMLSHLILGAGIGATLGRSLPKPKPMEIVEASASPRMDGIE